jgi:hypothetical protein
MQGEVRPARRADNSAALVVPNVLVSLEAQHFIHSWSLHDLFWESLPVCLSFGTYLPEMLVPFHRQFGSLC